MKIKDILTIHLEEDIKSVIDLNQQDDEEILEELNGFILTESLAKHLTEFCDFFTSNTAQPGLWLSGFYGSGKSYFAKMIGFLLKNPIINGTSIRERFASKLIGLPNESLMRNNIGELGKTTNHVVLFDSAKTTGNHPIAYMMMSAFLKSIGMNDDWVGIIEYNLLMSGRYQKFSEKVEEKFGESWTKRKKNMDQVYETLEDTMLDGFCKESAYNEMRDAAKLRIKNYDANCLYEDLKRYIELYPDIRIVFMIDEVSEAIEQNKINILDLEAVAESMTALDCRIWTIAIAQQQLDDVINYTNINRSTLTKIIDRFRKRINIEADEVDTIIRKRLLAKTDEGNELLQEYFKKNSGKISDITNVVGTGLRKTDSAITYADYFPFYEHQFKMLQYFLFGTHKLVKTQVGTRGMLISAFDVLKKESVSESDIHTNVNAAQLCRQAEESTDESLRVRYSQADEHLSEMGLKLVKGREMLQTIHFLTESGGKTTVENISRAYVNCPDVYYDVLEEVKKACKKLADDDILILSADEYRITSETQQRIIEMMNNYEGIAAYRIKGEITKQVKLLSLVRQSQSLPVDSLNVSFTITSDSGEPLSSGTDQGMKVVFHDILSVKPSRNEYVNKIKEDTQASKDVISVIPSPDYASEIQSVCESILRINYIEGVPNLTQDEKKVVDEIVNTLEDKTSQLSQLVLRSYNEGVLVYLYNTYILTEQTALNIIRTTESKMYDNIYTRRLSGSLKDSLALQLLKAGGENKLQSVIGQNENFLFFDTSGQFVGDQLQVVTEIMSQMTSYKNGADIERELSAAPTGYSFGTIFTTMAALFRANKVIIKYGGQDYHSWQQDGAKEPFMSSRNFQKASFKAVIKSLSYNDKRDVVDTLKECQYKELTSNNLSYNMNDFELVDAIRTLALKEMQKVDDKIRFDKERKQLFHKSIDYADNVLRQYTSAVTELNYFDTARTFLDDNNNEEFCNAIDKIEADIKFINKNLVVIKNQQVFFTDVKDEMNFVGVPMKPFDTINEKYETLLNSDPVSNFQSMQQECQKLKDLYFQYMEQYSDRMTALYTDLYGKLEALKAEVEKYPKEWNTELLDKIAEKQAFFKKYVVSKIELKDYEIKCHRSHLRLSDIDSAIKMSTAQSVEVDVMKTEVHTSNPKPAPKPTPTPGPNPQPIPTPQPKQVERKLKSQLPSGTLTVADYKRWLMNQLTMLKSYGETDILKFDE